MPRVPLSVLDLAPIREGSTPDAALRQSLELAPRVEALGYSRIWVAEHHNIAGVASSATAVLIGALADATSSIRVGSGGIMLPNHAPLVIAEQFGTLEALHPGRIDLGLGRAPGTDHVTGWALRRNPQGGVEFDAEVAELRAFLAPAEDGQRVRAIPGEGSNVPVYILGSSTYGAALAAQLGLPFAFASHFAPRFLLEAARIYREQFVPSAQLSKPYMMVGVTLLAADTDAEAEFLFTSTRRAARDAAAAGGHRRVVPAGRARGAGVPDARRSGRRRAGAGGEQVGGLGGAHRGRRGDRGQRRL